MTEVEENISIDRHLNLMTKQSILIFGDYTIRLFQGRRICVLTCDENKRTQTNSRDIYDEVQSVDSDKFDISEFSFQSVKKVNLKNSFSLLLTLQFMETCALQL